MVNEGRCLVSRTRCIMRMLCVAILLVAGVAAIADGAQKQNQKREQVGNLICDVGTSSPIICSSSFESFL